MELNAIILQAQAGNLVAYARLVEMTQQMVHAVCFRVLRHSPDALDAAQEAYLRAFKRLGELREPTAFAGWLRRIAITTSHDLRRQRRRTFVSLDEWPEVPMLDELESRWSESQRLSLAAALIKLSPEDRRLCDRFYHGNWSTQRLADDAGIAEPALRKRLERIRNKLRKEIEMNEQQNSPPAPDSLPARIVEMLAKPTLVDLPENPVGVITDLLRQQFPNHIGAPLEEIFDLNEILDLNEACRLLGCDPLYIPMHSLHSVDANRILRFDMTVPLLLHVRGKGAGGGSPLRLITVGKVYRNDGPSSTRLQVFHQLELLIMDDITNLNPWAFIGSVLGTLDAVLPRVPQRLDPTDYPICSHAWDVSLERDGVMMNVAGGGVYRPEIVRILGGDPARHTACGLGLGLERLATLKYHIDDIRKVESARV